MEERIDAELRDKARETRKAELEYKQRKYQKDLQELDRPQDPAKDSFFAGATVAELIEYVEKISPEQFQLFNLIGYLADTFRGMTPVERRKEAFAAVKIVRLADGAEFSAAYGKGLKDANAMLELGMMFGKSKMAATSSSPVAPPGSVVKATQPLMNCFPNAGSAPPGGSLTLELILANVPDQAKLTVVGAPAETSTVVLPKERSTDGHYREEEVTLTIPPTATPGLFHLTFEARDGENLLVTAPYGLTVQASPPTGHPEAESPHEPQSGAAPNQPTAEAAAAPERATPGA